MLLAVLLQRLPLFTLSQKRGKMKCCRADRLASSLPRIPNVSQRQNLFVLSEQMDSAGRSRRRYNLISLVGSRNLAVSLVCSQCRCIPTILSIQIFMRVPQRKWTQKKKSKDTNTFTQSKHFTLPNKLQLRQLIYLFFCLEFLHRWGEKRDICSFSFQLESSFYGSGLHQMNANAVGHVK